MKLANVKAWTARDAKYAKENLGQKAEVSKLLMADSCVESVLPCVLGVLGGEGFRIFLQGPLITALAGEGLRIGEAERFLYCGVR